MSNYLTTKQLAERWGLNPMTIHHWRMRGVGPKFLKLGHRVLYPLEVIESAEAKLSSSTAESQLAKNDLRVTWASSYSDKVE